MSDYSLQIKTTSNQGKSRTTTLSNVNPEATPATLIGFAQRLNLLTTNTYNQTDYVVKTTLDEETPPAPPDERQTPTITLDATPSAASINGSGGQHFDFTYDGDGITYVYLLNASSTVAKNANGVYTISKRSADITAGTIIIVGATGTDNYKPIELEVEIQA